MTTVTIGGALLAAFCNAINVITQHVASISSPQRETGWRFVSYLLHNSLWLLGWIALAGAFVFQALALHGGQMSVVQPLLVTELVFVLVLRRAWLRQPIRAVTWWAAAATCLALALFLATAEPQGGSDVPDSRAWITVSAATLGATAALTVLGMRGPPARRAALLACATAIMWALVATFIKTTTDTLSQFGVAGMFTHWPLYALAATALATEALQQVTLHVGPLSISQPLLVIVDPIMSIGLSVWIFGETFTQSAPTLAVGSFAFASLCAAVAVLTRTAPATVSS